MRSESAIETQWDPKGLREVSVQAQLTYHRATLRLAAFLERADGALVALLEILRRCHGDLTTLLRRDYQNAEPRRVLYACSKCAPSHGVLQCSRRSHRDGRRCRCVVKTL
uniref:Uncharacterized protein n=1 Tax=Magallana gigas TaxID=29159 RepID=K1RIC7_MAGGI